MDEYVLHLISNVCTLSYIRERSDELSSLSKIEYQTEFEKVSF